MGYWFGEGNDCYSWRKTPTKIGDTWYTPKGEKIHNPKAYFNTVGKRGRYWEGNTGWKKSNSGCNSNISDYDNSNNYYNSFDQNYEEEFSEPHDVDDEVCDFYDDY